MQTIDQYLPAHPFFAGLDSETTDLLAGCAVNVPVRAGEFLFRENDPADHFYVLRRGRVAVEVHTPARGVVLDTVNGGAIVGWSWMEPPYRWAFDARSTLDSSAVAVDAACLRAKCDARSGDRVRADAVVCPDDGPLAAIDPGTAARPVRRIR